MSDMNQKNVMETVPKLTKYIFFNAEVKKKEKNDKI